MSPDSLLFLVQLPQNAHATSNPVIRAGDLLRMTTAYLNRIATDVPEYDMHSASIVFARQMLAGLRHQARPGRLCSGRWM